MRFLITRPEDDAENFARLLQARGHQPVLAPLMQVNLHEGPEPALDNVQAILATSANGVRGFSARSTRRDIPLYAVGPQTAEAARSSGFAAVVSAEGDAAALVELVAARLDAGKGALLHAAGTETAGRLRQTLQTRGFTVVSEILYDAAPAAALPAAADAALRNDELDGVMLFSPRSAKIFADLVTRAGLAPNCTRVDAYCISAATAAALGGLTFARVAVAGQPNQDAMLALAGDATA
jgi:uroporphyrinogen-III synthase